MHQQCSAADKMICVQLLLGSMLLDVASAHITDPKFLLDKTANDHDRTVNSSRFCNVYTSLRPTVPLQEWLLMSVC